MSTEPMTYGEQKALVFRVIRNFPDRKPGTATKAHAAKVVAAIKAELAETYHHNISQIVNDLNQ